MILSPHNTLSVISKSGSPPTKPLSAIRSNTSPLRILADKTNGGDKENICQEPTTRLQKRLRIPSVYLDTESISCAMAARLASSLIGHVLFRKGQIPFPVARLGTVPYKSNSKASKKREELMSAVDTLSSHLVTTFAALSTSFAERGTNTPLSADCENDTKTNKSCTGSQVPVPAHMAIVLGPSVEAAQARVMLVVDGLEIKAIHTGNIPKCSISRSPSPSITEEDAVPDSDPESEFEDCIDHCQIKTPDSDSGSEPPLSRSPSPSPSESSSEPETADASNETIPRSTVPAPVAPKFVPFCETPSAPPKPLVSKPLPLGMRSSPLQQQSVSVPGKTGLGTKAPPRAPLGPSFEEQQQTLRAGDCLLSQVLFDACAEDDGGLSAVLKLTQMHVLIRAPRRFSHPAWVPRQNLTRILEKTLGTFLENAIVQDTEETTAEQKKRVSKTEGVWVGCKAQTVDHRRDEEDILNNEEDEMIWWVWDGKITGFLDW